MSTVLIPLASLALAGAATTTIYEGRVFAPGQATPAFTYERRVAVEGDGLVASHLTRDAAGALLIDETALVTGDYALRRFEAHNLQQGFRGSATLSADGRQLHFEVERGGRRVRATEPVRHPVVTGPSLHGFILQHWHRLVAGEAIDVRLVVLAKATTYGFRLRLHSSDEERVAFSVTPTNWLVRFAVAPLTVAFDPVTRHVLRYEGRVPPLRVTGGQAREFDARVDYTMKSSVYR